MADLSRFSDQNFQAASWVNTIIQELPDGDNLDSYLTSISMKLHMAAQDYSEQLETAMIESMSSMPRMIGEIGRLEDQLKSVQKEMENIEDNVRMVDKKNLSGLEDLSRLDHLKSNMDKCKSTLEEYSRWNQVVREAKQLLESGGILSDTADRISTMFQSLDILRNLPGHDDRQSTCHKFRTTLLDALRPNIQQELANMNVKALQEYSYVFRKLGSDDEFNALYTTQRPAHIKQLWAQINAQDRFSEWLALYLGTVSRFLIDEEVHVTELFGEEQVSSFCSSLLIAALSPMDSSLTEQLSLFADVNIVHECYLVTEEFARRSLLPRGDKVSERLQLLDAAFSGLWRFLPNYIEQEEKQLRRLLYQIMDRNLLNEILTEQAGEHHRSSAVFEDDIDPAVLIATFAERFLSEIQVFFEEITVFLKRAGSVFGGIGMKTAVRAAANLLHTLYKLVALKLGNVAVVLGLGDFSQGLATSSTSATTNSLFFEPYSSYLDENAFASTLTDRISASETSRAGLLSAALQAYKVIAHTLACSQTLEGTLVSLCNDLQLNVTLAQGLGDIAALLASAAGGKVTSLGLLYAQCQLLRDEDKAAELRSFLATVPSASSSGSRGITESNSSSYFQGILTNSRSLAQKLFAKTKELVLVVGTAVPQKTIAHYRAEDCWTRSLLPAQQLSEVQGQLLPLPVVTQVGEHLLSLVQVLEAYVATEESFLDNSKVPDYRDLEQNAMLVATSAGWKDVREMLHIVDIKALRQVCDRSQVIKLLTAYDRDIVALGLKEWSGDMEEEYDAVSGSTGEVDFVNEWLVLFSDYLVGLLAAQILALPSTITSLGFAQVLTDVEYFWYVSNATGIQPHPLLGHLKKLLNEHMHQPQELKNAIAGLNQGKSAGVLRDLLALDVAVLH